MPAATDHPLPPPAGHDLPPAGRSTRQREAIRRGLAQAAGPLTPLEVLAVAQADVPGLGIATVYRNLKWLVAEGQVRTVDLPGQAPRYEAAQQGPAHGHHPAHHVHHFHCERCDRVFPIHACPGSIEQLAPAGFRVERHDLTLHGLCAGCAAGASA